MDIVMLRIFLYSLTFKSTTSIWKMCIQWNYGVFIGKKFISFFGSDREPKKSLCVSVRPFGGMLFKALNFHHSGSNHQAISQK